MRRSPFISHFRRSITCKQFMLYFCLALLVLPVFAPALPAQAAGSDTGPADNLLQFISGGHALGFSPEGVFAVTGSHALKVEFVNGNGTKPSAISAGSDRGTVSPLARVTYSGAWDGVDIAYTAADSGIFESTYYLNKPECASSIRLRYNRPLSIDGQGNLLISFETGTMTETAPVAWQEIDGTRKAVEASFVIYNDREAGFELAGCRPDLPVTIDPLLAWNTFLGSTSDDQGNSIAVDGAGNVYVAGYSDATWGSPVTPFSTASDAFVAKLGNNGGLIWNTFIGGAGNDLAWGIALDAAGNIFVTGTSDQTWGTSPKRAFTGTGGWTDAFVAKFTNNGAFVWNTFLGGSGPDAGYGIKTHPSGIIGVAGSSMLTWGSPVNNPGGTGHAMVAVLNSDGSLAWHTFLGGTGSDSAFDLAIAPDLSIYIAGQSDTTWGSPVRAYTSGTSLWDGFVAKLNSAGALQWNTFLGGTSADLCSGIAMDGSGNLYVVGNSSTAWGSPLQNLGTGLVARLNSSGNLIWHSFLGGACVNVATDGGGNLSIAGTSFSSWGNPERPFTPPAPALVGIYGDGFAARMSSNGLLLWNTFLGSSYRESCSDIALDNAGNIYVCGTGNGTWGSPVRAYSYAMSGGPEPAPTYDAFAVRIARVTQTAYNTGLGTVNVIIDAGSVINTGWTTAADIRCSAPAGYIFPYGMFSFNINDLVPGQTARVTLRFPNPLPLGTKYYKCVNGSMVDITSLVTRVDEYTLALALTDGGLADADGQANGTYTDPGGPAFPLDAPQSSSAQMPSTTPQKPVSLSNISVKSASLSSSKVAPGMNVTVTADVANTGTGNGTASIKVYVNGAEEASRGITVNSGGTDRVSFDITRSEPGTYTVYVGGTSAGSFTVDQFAPDTMLFISGALVFFSFILGVIWMTRRRA